MLVAGDRIGEWVVESQLGEGGMGAVFACHSGLSQRVRAAVKVLKPHDLGAARERFVREVEVLASLKHPAVVQVLGGGEDPSRGLLSPSRSASSVGPWAGTRPAACSRSWATAWCSPIAPG